MFEITFKTFFFPRYHENYVLNCSNSQYVVIFCWGSGFVRFRLCFIEIDTKNVEFICKDLKFGEKNLQQIRTEDAHVGGIEEGHQLEKLNRLRERILYTHSTPFPICSAIRLRGASQKNWCGILKAWPLKTTPRKRCFAPRPCLWSPFDTPAQTEFFSLDTAF